MCNYDRQLHRAQRTEPYAYCPYCNASPVSRPNKRQPIHKPTTGFSSVRRRGMQRVDTGAYHMRAALHSLEVRLKENSRAIFHQCSIMGEPGSGSHYPIARSRQQAAISCRQRFLATPANKDSADWTVKSLSQPHKESLLEQIRSLLEGIWHYAPFSVYEAISTPYSVSTSI
ncbi:hypothetical protein BDZ91DRAFT_764568 [Kalaharituber pfeilii]|nr:hypothetical protein BDZ91DRAFT_764568 [Kalaharituber pfeilii]